MKIDYAEFARNYSQAIYRLLVRRAAWADMAYSITQSDANAEACDWWNRLCDMAADARDEVEDNIWDALARRRAA